MPKGHKDQKYTLIKFEDLPHETFQIFKDYQKLIAKEIADIDDKFENARKMQVEEVKIEANNHTEIGKKKNSKAKSSEADKLNSKSKKIHKEESKPNRNSKKKFIKGKTPNRRSRVASRTKTTRRVKDKVPKQSRKK